MPYKDEKRFVCAQSYLEYEIDRIENAIEQQLVQLTKDDNKNHEWGVNIFYKFEFNEKYELSDQYTIKVIYFENEDAK